MCPLGCEVTVKYDEMDNIVEVVGQKCPKGEKYARDEFKAPRRVLTSTVAIEGGPIARLPVRTSGLIPKDRVFDCMKEVENVKIKVPVRAGDVILKNILGLNVDIVATRDVEKCQEPESNRHGI